MMEEFTSLCALITQLRKEQFKLIGVDGTNGARKTTVAGVIAMELELPLISLDSYIHMNQGGFIEFLQYEELDKDLKKHQHFVVEGVCLLQALERVNIKLDTLLYVKRYHIDQWADERELNVPAEEVEDFLKEEYGFTSLLSGTTSERDSCLFDDIVRYHSQYLPQEHARYLFRWDER